MATQPTQDRRPAGTKGVVLLGYSGHAYTVIEILQATGRRILGYCDVEEKSANPYGLNYLGREGQLQGRLEEEAVCFSAIGRNDYREAAARVARQYLTLAAPAVHPSAIISDTARIGPGALIGAAAVINAQAVIAEGVIINTAAIVEHDCSVAAYAHVAPGAVLTGNVCLGARVFVGAGAIILPGVTIGEDATIGAGAVVLRDVPPGKTFVGNPAKNLP